jgi:predicted nucleic acid-binding protein
MIYVLDSSVALKWVLPEVDSAKALRVLDDYNQSIHRLLAPQDFLSEVANGLATAERHGRIKLGESAAFFLDVVRQAPNLHPSSPLLVRAMEISVSNRQAVYDCIYVALAEKEGCELLTADDAMVRRLKPRFPFVVRLSDLP